MVSNPERESERERETQRDQLDAPQHTQPLECPHTYQCDERALPFLSPIPTLSPNETHN